MHDELTGPWRPPTVPTGTTVFHYCDPGGLYGALTTRVLWATEATGMNDLSELHHGRGVVAELLQELLDAIPDDGVLTELVHIARDEHAAAQERSTTYLLCASLDGDDAAQWRLYGGDRAGYAIHLDADIELRVVRRGPEPTMADDPDEPPSWSDLLATMADVVDARPWHPVAYTQDEGRHLVQHLVRWAQRRQVAHDRAMADVYASLGPNDGQDEFEANTQPLRDEIRFDFTEAVAIASALIKPEGFRGEREVRVVATARWGDEHACLRSNDLGVVRYLRLSTAAPDGEPAESRSLLTDDVTARVLPVTGLRVAPTPYFERTKTALQTLLERSGIAHPISTGIYRSGVPLRR